MPVTPVSPSAVRAASGLRILVGRLRRRLIEVSRLSELTPSQTAILGRLARGDADSASSLAAAEGIKPQSVAVVLTALAEQRLIERRPDPSDGRRQLVRLTATGRRRVEGSRQARDEWLARALQDDYTEAERRTILQALSLLERLT